MADNEWPNRDDGKRQMSARHDSVVSPHLQDKPQTARAPSGSQSDPSPFLDLPEELRLQTYHYLLSDGVHLHFTTIDGPTSALTTLTTPSQVCRQLYYEFSPLIPRLSVFHFHLPLLQDPVPRPPPQPSSPRGNPLPAQGTSSNRHSSGFLPATPNAARHLRRVSEEFYDLALGRGMQEAVARFVRVCARVPALRRVCVHLGTQTCVIFPSAFHAAWAAVMPGLGELRQRVGEVRVRFELRLSRRLVGRYAFGINGDLGKALGEIDAGLECEGLGSWEQWEPTLPELGAVNEVRRMVGESLWPGVEVGYWNGM